MNKLEAEKLISHLDADQRVDLLMHLAEEFEYRVYSGNEEKTYFLPTGTASWGKNKLGKTVIKDSQGKIIGEQG